MSLVSLIKKKKQKIGAKPKLGSYSNVTLKRNTRKRHKKGKPKFRSDFEEEFWNDNHTKIRLRYEPFYIDFTVLQHKKYLPDFVYQDPFIKGENNLTVYETKGWWRAADRTKMLALRDSNPGLRIVMVFQRDNYLTKAKKIDKDKPPTSTTKKRMKYSDWCIKNRIDFCIGTNLDNIVCASNPNRVKEDI